MENLEKSELVMAKILGLLVEWGLSNSELQFEQLGLSEDFLPFFATCVEWLEAEGIIRTRKIEKGFGGSAWIFGPTLTAHGLAIMGKKIEVGNSNITVGAAVQQTSKETSFYTGLGDLGGGFVGGLFKSLGNG